MVSKALFVVAVVLILRFLERNTPLGALEKSVGVAA